jgi:hypothetical protein
VAAAAALWLLGLDDADRRVVAARLVPMGS